MPTKTGITSLNKTAKRLCRLLGDFTPLLSVLYAENAALMAALAAANAACAELVIQTEALIEYGD